MGIAYSILEKFCKVKSTYFNSFAVYILYELRSDYGWSFSVQYDPCPSQ